MGAFKLKGMFGEKTLRRIENYERERRAIGRHAAQRDPLMRHWSPQPGIDYPILPPNPQPRGVPNGRPRTCYHGWYPGICNDPRCRSDPRETGPYVGPGGLRLAHLSPPRVYIINSGGHGHPFHGGIRPPNPYHLHPHHHPHHHPPHHHPHHHGGSHYPPHGGYDPYADYDEEDDELSLWDFDDDDLSVYSDSALSMMGAGPMYNSNYGHGGYGHPHDGGHIPLSYYHQDHRHQRSIGSSYGTEESW